MSKKNNNKIDLKITAPAVQFSFESAKTTAFAVAGAQKTLYLLPFLPTTPFTTVEGDYRNGIEFTYDADAIISTFNAENRPLILDVDHNSEFGYSDTKARGWIYALFKHTDLPELNLDPGMYAGIELTSLGTEELGDKLYGYTSAVVLPNKDTPYHFVRAKSLALTNNPATKMPAAFTANADGSYTLNNEIFTNNNKKENEMDKTKLIAAFGLSADASDEAIIQAATAFSAIKTEFENTKTQLQTANAEIATFKAAKFEADCNSAVDEAIKSGKITPAQRESMLTLAKANLESFKVAMESAPAVVATTVPADLSTVSASNFGLTESELATAAAFGLTAEQYAKAKTA